MRGPVVQDHAQEVDVRAFEGLLMEEVVALEDDAGCGFGVEAGERGLTVTGVFGEVLHDEVQVREGLGESDACAAGGAANLDLFVRDLVGLRTGLGSWNGFPREGMRTTNIDNDCFA